MYGKSNEAPGMRGNYCFVSHELGLIQSICDRVAWIDGGRLIMLGYPKDVAEHYHQELSHLPKGVGITKTAFHTPSGGEGI